MTLIEEENELKHSGSGGMNSNLDEVSVNLTQHIKTNNVTEDQLDRLDQTVVVSKDKKGSGMYSPTMGEEGSLNAITSTSLESTMFNGDFLGEKEERRDGYNDEIGIRPEHRQTRLLLDLTTNGILPSLLALRRRLEEAGLYQQSSSESKGWGNKRKGSLFQHIISMEPVAASPKEEEVILVNELGDDNCGYLDDDLGYRGIASQSMIEGAMVAVGTPCYPTTSEEQLVVLLDAKYKKINQDKKTGLQLSSPVESNATMGDVKITEVAALSNEPVSDIKKSTSGIFIRSMMEESGFNAINRFRFHVLGDTLFKEWIDKMEKKSIGSSGDSLCRKIISGGLLKDSEEETKKETEISFSHSKSNSIFDVLKDVFTSYMQLVLGIIVILGLSACSLICLPMEIAIYMVTSILLSYFIIQPGFDLDEIKVQIPTLLSREEESNSEISALSIIEESALNETCPCPTCLAIIGAAESEEREEMKYDDDKAGVEVKPEVLSVCV
jgi:hypothetical protein